MTDRADLPDRFAALADIHGNADALAAVFADLDARGPECAVNLGDCLSGPLWAARTAALLRDRPMPTVRGNHDRWLTDRPAAAMGRWDAWADAEIDAATRGWLAGLPPVLRLGDVVLCHATPQDDTTYWLHRAAAGRLVARPRTDIAARAGDPGVTLWLCGHTHRQGAVVLPGGRLVVNPGSVGSPAYADDAPEPHVSEAGSPHARYAVLERRPGGWAVEFRLVPYDSRAAVARARARGAEDWVRPLTEGRV